MVHKNEFSTALPFTSVSLETSLMLSKTYCMVIY